MRSMQRHGTEEYISGGTGEVDLFSKGLGADIARCVGETDVGRLGTWWHESRGEKKEMVRRQSCGGADERGRFASVKTVHPAQAALLKAAVCVAAEAWDDLLPMGVGGRLVCTCCAVAV